MDKSKVESKNNDVIEIPIGKIGRKLKSNPWIIFTFVLGLVVIFLLVYGKGVTGGAIGESKAAENVLGFINSNQGLEEEVKLVSIERDGSLYALTVSYQGQELPLYSTLDGKYLVSSIVPLSEPVGGGSGSGSGGGSGVVASEDDDAILGDKNAEITIIEFSDYQCPFCERFWSDTLPLIKKEYIDTGKVKLVYRDFPLTSIHPQAQGAAEAAECVREKGGDEAYFSYHDKIFGNQQSLSDSNLKKWAKELGYDIDSCLDSGKYRNEVLNDLNDGSSAGVSGTPAFFINGVFVEGAQPFANFKQIIDAELSA